MLLCLKVERALKCQLPSLSTAFHRHKDRSENGAVGNCDMAGVAARWRSSAAGSSLDTMLGIRVLCLLSLTCVRGIVFDVQTVRSFFFTSDARQRNRGVGGRAFFQGLI